MVTNKIDYNYFKILSGNSCSEKTEYIRKVSKYWFSKILLTNTHAHTQMPPDIRCLESKATEQIKVEQHIKRYILKERIWTSWKEKSKNLYIKKNKAQKGLKFLCYDRNNEWTNLAKHEWRFFFKQVGNITMYLHTKTDRLTCRKQRNLRSSLLWKALKCWIYNFSEDYSW